MPEGERRIDAPAGQRSPAGVGITVGRVRARAPLPMVREPQLGGGQVKTLCDLDQRVMFSHGADLRLMPKHLFGKCGFPDVRQLDRALHVGEMVDWWIGADERVDREL